MSSEYDRLAAKYDRLYQNESINQQQEIDAGDLGVEPVRLSGWPADRKQALVYLARPGGRLLEIGCGRGEVLTTLAPLFDEVIGVEISSIRATRTGKALAHLTNCRILNAPLEALLEFIDAPVDCIVWADVIEHIADVIEAMHILAGLSKPGTQLVTVTPNVGFLPQRLNILRGRAPNTAMSWYPNEGFAKDPRHTRMLDAGHLHYFTFRQIEILYEMAGFCPERRLGVGHRFTRLRNWWPTLFSGLVCISGIYRGCLSETDIHR
jgi:2-polyprenyl-3-methyl-5-hydroxy-6-metoxy-1,4-benzoquinol methylase